MLLVVTPCGFVSGYQCFGGTCTPPPLSVAEVNTLLRGRKKIHPKGRSSSMKTSGVLIKKTTVTRSPSVY